MIVHHCTQGSPEWFELRRGIPTASNFDRILTPKTGKPSASADPYISELIAERYHIGPLDELEATASDAMKQGLALEPEARHRYEAETGVAVAQVGFVTTDDGRLGCSPDGLVGDSGGLEVKCPSGKTHVGYLRERVLPDDYKAQVHGSLIVTGRKWWDFVSYCHGLPLFRVRVVPDEYTDRLREALYLFVARYENTIRDLGLPDPPVHVAAEWPNPNKVRIS